MGCARRDRALLGKWSGGFEVERLPENAAIKPRKRNNLTGYLQLYGTESKYELSLDGEQFGVVVTGNWASQEGRITLRPSGVKVDDGGGQESRDPNKAWIDPAVLSAAYSRPISLRLSKDGQRLEGVLIDVGPLVGTHRFKREGSGR